MLSPRTDGHHPVGRVDVRSVNLIIWFIYQPGVRENGTGFIKAVNAKRITQIASYPYPQEQQTAKATMSGGSIPSIATNAEGRAESNPCK